MNKTNASTRTSTMTPIVVNTEQLSHLLSCGLSTARKIGEDAHAKIVYGRRVLYSVDKVKQYIQDIAT